MQGKIIQFDYDYILERETSEVSEVCLSYHERQILLTLVEYIGWSKRWYSGLGTTISQDKIDLWRDSISRRLMFGVCEMDCNDVWACLGITETPPGSILAWLLEQLSSNGDVINTINVPSPEAISPVVYEEMVANCDYDYLYGFCVQLIQYINRACEDFYELLELVSNPLEFTQIVSEKSPLLSMVTDYVNFMQEAIVEAYLANYDATLEQEYICAVFCIAKLNDGCSLTWMELYEYFLARVGTNLENKHILDLLEFLVGGNWEGTEFCDLTFAAFCGVMHNLGTWLGIDLNGIKLLWESWGNDPNTDWITLCVDCGWELIQMLDSSHEETWWTNSFGLLEFDRVASEPIPSLGYRGLVINVTLPEVRRVNTVTSYYRKTEGSPNSVGIMTLFDVGDNVLAQHNWTMVNSSIGWDAEEYTFDQNNVSRVKIELYCNTSNPYGDGYCATNEIKITGTGLDPFI